MFRGFKNLKEAYNIPMSNFFKNLNLLQYLFLLVVIFHQTFVNSFYRNIFARQLMNTKSNFSKGSFTDQLHKFIIVYRSLRYFWSRW